MLQITSAHWREGPQVSSLSSQKADSCVFLSLFLVRVADCVVSQRGTPPPLLFHISGRSTVLATSKNGTPRHHELNKQAASLQKYRLARHTPRYGWVATYRRWKPRSTHARSASQPAVAQTTDNGTGLPTSHKSWWDAEGLVNQWPPKGQVVWFRTCNYGNTSKFLVWMFEIYCTLLSSPELSFLFLPSMP